MNIQITGCNNCPLAASGSDDNFNLVCYCNYKTTLDISLKKRDASTRINDIYQHIIPKECPIKATESKSITISITNK